MITIIDLKTRIEKLENKISILEKYNYNTKILHESLSQTDKQLMMFESDSNSYGSQALTLVDSRKITAINAILDSIESSIDRLLSYFSLYEDLEKFKDEIFCDDTEPERLNEISLIIIKDLKSHLSVELTPNKRLEDTAYRRICLLIIKEYYTFYNSRIMNTIIDLHLENELLPFINDCINYEIDEKYLKVINKNTSISDKLKLITLSRYPNLRTKMNEDLKGVNTEFNKVKAKKDKKERLLEEKESEIKEKEKEIKRVHLKMPVRALSALLSLSIMLGSGYGVFQIFGTKSTNKYYKTTTTTYSETNGLNTFVDYKKYLFFPDENAVLSIYSEADENGNRTLRQYVLDYDNQTDLENMLNPNIEEVTKLNTSGGKYPEIDKITQEEYKVIQTINVDKTDYTEEEKTSALYITISCILELILMLVFLHIDFGMELELFLANILNQLSNIADDEVIISTLKVELNKLYLKKSLTEGEYNKLLQVFNKALVRKQEMQNKYSEFSPLLKKIKN